LAGSFDINYFSNAVVLFDSILNGKEFVRENKLLVVVNDYKRSHNI